MELHECIKLYGLGDLNIDQLDGFNLTRLLNLHPEFIDICDLSKLSDIDWAFLVCHRPEFTDRCPWWRFTEDGFTYLLHYTGKWMGVQRHWLKLNESENRKIQSILTWRPKRI